MFAVCNSIILLLGFQFCNFYFLSCITRNWFTHISLSFSFYVCLLDQSYCWFNFLLFYLIPFYFGILDFYWRGNWFLFLVLTLFSCVCKSALVYTLAHRTSETQHSNLWTEMEETASKLWCYQTINIKWLDFTGKAVFALMHF